MIGNAWAKKGCCAYYSWVFLLGFQRATGFYRQVKIFELRLFILKNVPLHDQTWQAICLVPSSNETPVSS